MALRRNGRAARTTQREATGVVTLQTSGDCLAAVAGVGSEVATCNTLRAVADVALIGPLIHAHNLQEDAMDKFDVRFGINRHEIAARLYAEFTDEMERQGRR